MCFKVVIEVLGSQFRWIFGGFLSRILGYDKIAAAYFFSQKLQDQQFYESVGNKQSNRIIPLISSSCCYKRLAHTLVCMGGETQCY